jgi:hypothetical protein
MGRPKGAPTRRKEFRLEDRQVELLEALRVTAPLGTPPLVSIVRQAVEQFISREMAKPEVRERVDAYLNERRKVVNLREVGKG